MSSADYLGSTFNVHDDSTFDVDELVRIERCQITIQKGGSLIIDGPTLLRECVIFISEGAKLIVGSDSRIGFSRLSVRYSGASLKIGRYFRAFNQTDIYCDESITIGDYVLMARLTSLSDTQTHNLDYRERRKAIIDAPVYQGMAKELKPKTNPLIIGNDCWFCEGSRVIIGKTPITIGDRCVIAAGSTVKQSAPPNSLLVGAPATVKRVLGC